MLQGLGKLGKNCWRGKKKLIIRTVCCRQLSYSNVFLKLLILFKKTEAFIIDKIIILIKTNSKSCWYW